MVILSGEYLTFDDVLLVPQYSDIESRKDIDISTNIAGIKLKIPLISANMSSITEEKMSQAMWDVGGLGILHRFAAKEKIINWIEYLNSHYVPAIISVGIKEEDKKFVKELIKQKISVNAVTIDIAHGHSKHTGEMIKFLKDFDFKIIAGNIASIEGGIYLAKEGADVLKVGLGNGSVCTTRTVTGHGIPQLSSLIEVSKIKQDYNIKIIADGGIRNSGDIIKVIACGADCAMIGRLFSGCEETPGEIVGGKKVYCGSASFSAQMDRDGFIHNDIPEGESCFVEAKESVKEVVKLLAGGIRSGFSYSGCSTIREFQENSILIKVK